MEKPNLNKLPTPTAISEYRHIAAAGEYSLELTQDEACLALKIHDYGVRSLDASDIDLLYSLIHKLKIKIHP